MAKWFGKIGYSETVETDPGIWTEKITEREYYGDVYRNSRTFQNSGSVNDDINVNNSISIVADPFAYQNFHNIKYVEFMGTLWKAYNIEVQYPRLSLTIGGVYNGDTASTTEDPGGDVE